MDTWDGQYQKEIAGQTEDVIDGAPIYIEPLLVYVIFGTTTENCSHLSAGQANRVPSHS
jgi:hypothetical protein